MIYVKLMGGVGNQMFQYALGRRLALKHPTSVKLDPTALGTFRMPREYELEEPEPAMEET